MTPPSLTRRMFIGGVAGTAGFTVLGGRAFAQLVLPKSPVTLSVVDVAGNLALTQKAIENYRKAKPNLVSRITFTKAPAPELPSKIKAQQEANRVDIDLVLTGTDALAAGLDQNLWVELLPAYQAALPKPDEIYLEGASKMQALAKGHGVVVTYYPSGPRGLFRCPRFRWIRSRRPSMIAADGRFSLAPRISATVSGRSALRPVPA